MEEEDGELWQGFNKSQLLRVVMQLLVDMGYTETVETLEKESGCIYQCESVKLLEKFIKSGDMAGARSHLSQLKVSSDIRMACAFLCSQESFATALYHKDTDKALKILREDLSPSAFDEDTKRRVKLCASLLVYPTTEHILRSELRWEAKNSLRNLWMYIQRLISPELCIPPNRMITLLRQAVEYQEMYCKYHRTSNDIRDVPTLYEDHSCKDIGTPSRCIAKLDGHVDEIWDIAVSPNEKYFATAGMDMCVLLWRSTQPFDLLHTWEEHVNMVISVCWSSDSILLATLSSAGNIVIFSPGSSAPLLKIENNLGPHNYIHWVPGRWELLTGGDTKITLYEITSRSEGGSTNYGKRDWVSQENGKSVKHVARPTYRVEAKKKCNIDARIRSLTVNHEGKYAYFSTPDCTLHVLNLHTFKEYNPLHENATITMLTCSALYNQVLVSVAGQHPVLRLWDMDNRRLIQTYHGHREERYVLKPTLGGPDECYVVSGSEDTQIYIWNKLFGTLVAVIAAHSSTVNGVAWSITPGAFLYSASDDGQIAIWEPLPIDDGEDFEMN
ncbi:wd repeat protein 26-related protein [Babesia gibsoni]|uniref:Wd repeat protein 26-related protein n=1 Tax=Babesia gibsoni TaxID=33632 RepID=A0AAD8LNK4_BABGI|nr:wd repeat protein 26-related protein [Babesia gibsoni]